MSSAATAGAYPPPNSRVHNSNGEQPVGARNGYAPHGGGGKGSGKIFKHIKDVLAARPEFDINSPIRKILLDGEQHAKNADSFYDFRRPDLALEEYLKASILAVEVIPRHKDYPELQSDRGDLHRLYTGLKKRVSSQQDLFDGAKNIIKENNNQHGTQPAKYGDRPNEAVHTQTNSLDAVGNKGTTSSHISFPRTDQPGSSALANGDRPSANQPQPNINSNIDKRPAVHSKPEALQGRSLKSKDAPAQTVEDLTSRFARLRGADTASRNETLLKHAPVQDPRIKTRPIVVPSYAAIPSNNAAQSHSGGASLPSRPNRPLGPRDIPSGPSKPLKIALGVEIPEMPRPPEAVYSPARNLDASSHSELLADHPKAFNNFISRTPSIDSTMDLGRSVVSVDDNNPYFYNALVEKQVPARGPHLSRISEWEQDQHPSHPELSRLKNITAQQLQRFMKIGQSFRILIVDVRNREDFDNGHILWSSVICIEPISLRAGVSADEIEQSMVISPDAEQQAFLQRHKYSLVVYYDQSASSSSMLSSYGKETALQDFHKAVYDFSYEKRLQNRPLLLEGGLDAWVDLVGPGALAISKSLLPAKANGRNSLSSARLADVSGCGIVVDSANKEDNQYQDNKEIERSGHLSPGSKTERDDSTDDFYFKTAEDFMRRYPAASDIKQSMMSPSSQLMLPSQGPAIPQKAVTPGHMFSRLNSSSDTASKYQTLWGEGRIGLFNRSNLCYMNASIQALSSMHELRDYLFRGSWVKNKPSKEVPMSSESPSKALIDQQLATKTFSNLLMHLWSADASNCSYINPRTFVATINRLHIQKQGKPDRATQLGGTHQQDAEEFITFLFERLEEETSPDQIPWTWSDEYGIWLDEQPDISVAAISAYQKLEPESQSPIAKLKSFLQISAFTCRNCNKRSRVFDKGFSSSLIIHLPTEERSFTLRQLLQFLCGSEDASDSGFACRYCEKKCTLHRNNLFLAYLPTILMVRFTRETYVVKNTRDDSGKIHQEHVTTKMKSQVIFPENNLDLADFLTPGKYGPQSMKSTKYDCFAVVCHYGTSLRSGHYTTYRRDMVDGRYKEWWEYNDTQTRASSFGEICSKSPDAPYVLFYRLQGTWEA